MTFNEGMQIDTSNIAAGGGRGPGRGIAIGGGLGGLVIVVIALLLGVDPSTVVPQQGQIATGGVEAPGYDLSHCKTGADANKYVECRVVATTNSVDGVWQQQLRGYTPPHTMLFHGQVQTGCGPATSDVGPFYCPVGWRRPHPKGRHWTGQPRILDARILCRAAEVVHRRLPDRRPEEM